MRPGTHSKRPLIERLFPNGEVFNDMATKFWLSKFYEINALDASYAAGLQDGYLHLLGMADNRRTLVERCQASYIGQMWGNLFRSRELRHDALETARQQAHEITKLVKRSSCQHP